jgi:hypothetical protein
MTQQIVHIVTAQPQWIKFVLRNKNYVMEFACCVSPIMNNE